LPKAANLREAFAADLGRERDMIPAMAKALIACRCETPLGDTRAMADAVERLVGDVPEIEFERHAGAPHIVNLVMRVRGGRPGRRLIFNGHMDTFPLVDATRWTLDPAGEERDGRLYGLGSSDMKSGLAAILFALRHLARHRETWAGEVVATFAGDEETMGEMGSQFLLDTAPHARGHAMISADAGSPRVLRFGEKGMIWLTLQARGRSSHAAHVHRGDSAIDKLLAVIGELQKLRHFTVNAPAAVTAAIAEAAAISEPLSGAGESDVLQSVTVTIGTIKGGRLRNLVSDAAEATADIRIPIGVTVGEIEALVLGAVAAHEQQGEGFELLGEVRAQSFPGRAHPEDVAALPALATRQPAGDLAAVLEDIEVAPGEHFGVVVAKDQATVFGAACGLPQSRRLPDLQKYRPAFPLKSTLDHFPVQAQT